MACTIAALARSHDRRNVWRNASRMIALAYVAPFVVWSIGFIGAALGLLLARAIGNLAAFDLCANALWIMIFQPITLELQHPYIAALIVAYGLGCLLAIPTQAR